MGKTAESVVIAASAAEVWAIYFEPTTWPTWVDGFGGVDDSDGYPEQGGTLRWHSTPAGRGRVVERVLEYAPRTRHRIEFSDDESEGELTTTLEVVSGEGSEPATRVTQALTYQLRGAGPLRSVTDYLFVRPQMQRSLGRSLERLRREVTELAAESAEGAPPDAAV